MGGSAVTETSTLPTDGLTDMPHRTKPDTPRHTAYRPRLSGAALRAAVAGAALVALFSAAMAQNAAPDARTACRADYKAYCAGTRPGDGRIRKCMTDNFDKLSEPCKKVIGASK